MIKTKLHCWGHVIFRTAYGERTDVKGQEFQGTYQETKVMSIARCLGILPISITLYVHI